MIQLDPCLECDGTTCEHCVRGVPVNEFSVDLEWMVLIGPEDLDKDDRKESEGK
jgi:hypothetical protein